MLYLKINELNIYALVIRTCLYKPSPQASPITTVPIGEKPDKSGSLQDDGWSDGRAVDYRRCQTDC